MLGNRVGSPEVPVFSVGCSIHTGLETDHKPLEWLESAKVSHARSQHLETWSLELRAYDFKVVHCPGKDNCHVDSLSRLPILLVALQAPITTTEISKAQRSDSSLSLIIKAVEGDSYTLHNRMETISPAQVQTNMVTAPAA